MAILESNKKRIKKLNPKIKDAPGIYFLTRETEDGKKAGYIGQAGGLRKDKNGEWVTVKQGVLTRLAQHLGSFSQHVDRSLKAHGLYSEDNPYGYKVEALYFEPKELNEKEQFYIAQYLEQGYELKNHTTGSQGVGKKQLGEPTERKGYNKGKEAGYKKASKEIAHLFDLHLDAVPKKEPPTVNQQKAMSKFQEFLDYHKEN